MQHDNQTHNLSEAYHPLSSKGRFNRMSYLGWLMLTGFVFIILLMIAISVLGIGSSILAGAQQGDMASVVSALTSGAGLITLLAFIVIGVYITVVVNVRRLHDLDKSGWLVLLAFIPLVNLLFFLYVTLMPGTLGVNRFGAPRPSTGWEKVLAWLYIIVNVLYLVITVLAVLGTMPQNI